jgi:hypothetical protein
MSNIHELQHPDGRSVTSSPLIFPHPPPPHPHDEYDRQIRGLLQVLNQTPGSRLTGKIAGGDLLDVSLPEHKLLQKLFTAADHLTYRRLTFTSMPRYLTLQSTLFLPIRSPRTHQ